jgi:monoamine oxidase
MSGYTSELLAKVIKRGELDQMLTADDREKFIEYLRGEGRLNADLIYPHSGDSSETPAELDHTRGYTNSPGALGETGKPTPPMDLEALVKAGYANSLGFMKDYNQQPTMLTPIGGMDRIVQGFVGRINDPVRHRAEVKEIRRGAGEGVRVRYADGAHGGGMREIEGDFCICALPPHLLRNIPSDFAPATMTALRNAVPAAAGKIGLQFKRRFWEEDDDIYGGCSKTDDPIGQVYYPFDDYGSRGKGVVIGYYHFGEAKEPLDDQTPAVRERRALEQGAKIHPQYPGEFENSFSVAWQRVPFNEAPWTLWKDAASFEADFKTLRSADGPFYFAGDWVSNLSGWQAGAFVAAHHAIQALHQRASAG